MGLLVNNTKQTEPLWIGWNPTSNSEGGESFVAREVQGRGERYGGAETTCFLAISTTFVAKQASSPQGIQTDTLFLPVY